MPTRTQKHMRHQHDTTDFVHAFGFSPGCRRPALHSGRFKRRIRRHPQWHKSFYQTRSGIRYGWYEIHKSTSSTPLHSLAPITYETRRPSTGKLWCGNAWNTKILSPSWVLLSPLFNSFRSGCPAVLWQNTSRKTPTQTGLVS